MDKVIISNWGGAADYIRVQYENHREGWSIQQSAGPRVEPPDVYDPKPDWKEVAFVKDRPVVQRQKEPPEEADNQSVAAGKVQDDH